MPCTLTRAVVFHARHRYYRAAWDHGENQKRFGWTSDAPGHGHLYRVEFSVTGPLDPETSMIIDLVVLDELIDRLIVRPLAGNHLNEVIEVFQREEALPTCEAIALWCWQQVAADLPLPAKLERVRVAEDDSLWADCTA